MILAYISHWGLDLYRNAEFAPLWHALVTPDNALVLNAVAAVVTTTCLTVAVGRLLFGRHERRVRLVPSLFAVSFFVVPPFLRHLFDLSPVMFTMLPIALSLVMLAYQNWRDQHQGGKDDEDVRSGRFGFGIAASGAFAAVAAWEGTLGVAFVPLLLILALSPVARGSRRFFEAGQAWTIGFVVAFVAEGVGLGFPWLAFKPVTPPLAGLAVFVFIGIIPALFVHRFGENRWTLGGWAAVLLVSGAVAAQIVGGNRVSGCEKFVRAVLADLGDRTLIVSDGRFDDYFDLLKPAGVRVVGMRTNEDREFLLNYFDDGTSVTNRALLVRNYYSLPEMDEAAAELGLMRRVPQVAPTADKASSGVTNVVMTQEALQSNAVSRLRQEAEPLVRVLTSVEAELKKPVREQNREVLLRGQEEIRKIWRKGIFRGTRLSNALLMTDIMLTDLVSLESDAITALMIDRNDPTANGALGAIRQEQGKLESAERYLRKGVKGGGVFPMGKLAILLVQTDRPAEAVEWARKAIGQSPKDITLHEPLAAALIESGAFDEAERELETIRQLAAEQGSRERERSFLTGAHKRLSARRAEERLKKRGAK